MEEQQHSIDEIFRQSLGDYREAPPAAAWEDVVGRLDGDLPGRGGRRFPRWPWICLVLLVFIGGTWWLVAGNKTGKQTPAPVAVKAVPASRVVHAAGDTSQAMPAAPGAQADQEAAAAPAGASTTGDGRAAQPSIDPAPGNAAASAEEARPDRRRSLRQTRRGRHARPAVRPTGENEEQETAGHTDGNGRHTRSSRHVARHTGHAPARRAAQPSNDPVPAARAVEPSADEARQDRTRPLRQTRRNRHGTHARPAVSPTGENGEQETAGQNTGNAQTQSGATGTPARAVARSNRRKAAAARAAADKPSSGSTATASEADLPESPDNAHRSSRRHNGYAAGRRTEKEPAVNARQQENPTAAERQPRRGRRPVRERNRSSKQSASVAQRSSTPVGETTGSRAPAAAAQAQAARPVVKKNISTRPVAEKQNARAKIVPVTEKSRKQETDVAATYKDRKPVTVKGNETPGRTGRAAAAANNTAKKKTDNTPVVEKPVRQPAATAATDPMKRTTATQPAGPPPSAKPVIPAGEAPEKKHTPAVTQQAPRSSKPVVAATDDGKEEDGAEETAGAAAGGGPVTVPVRRHRRGPDISGPLSLDVLAGYEWGLQPPAPGKVNVALQLSWHLGTRVDIGIVPAYRFGSISSQPVAGGNFGDYRSVQVDSVKTRDSIGGVFHDFYTYKISQSYDSIRVPQGSAGGKYWDLELPVVVGITAGNWRFYGGPSFSFGGKLNVTAGGPSQRFTLRKFDSVTSMDYQFPSDTFRTYFRRSLPDYSSYQSAVPQPDAVRIGYTVGVSYQYRGFLFNLSAHQQLTGFSGVTDDLRKVYSSPAFRINVGYRLFGPRPLQRDAATEKNFLQRL